MGTYEISQGGQTTGPIPYDQLPSTATESGFKDDDDEISLGDLIDRLEDMAIRCPPTDDAGRERFVVAVASIADAMVNRWLEILRLYDRSHG